MVTKMVRVLKMEEDKILNKEICDLFILEIVRGEDINLGRFKKGVKQVIKEHIRRILDDDSILDVEEYLRENYKFM